MPQSDEIIWPISIRVIHWALAIIIILDAFFLEDSSHRYLGYAGVGLIALRLFLGLNGKGAQRLSSMPVKFSDIKFFFRNHFKGEAHYVGHNPMASIVYILIWMLVIALGVSGFMMELDAFWGDERLETIHAYLSNGLIFLTIIHIVGMLVDAFIYKRKTWMGMIDGRKK